MLKLTLITSVFFSLSSTANAFQALIPLTNFNTKAPVSQGELSTQTPVRQDTLPIHSARNFASRLNLSPVGPDFESLLGGDGTEPKTFYYEDYDIVMWLTLFPDDRFQLESVTKTHQEYHKVSGFGIQHNIHIEDKFLQKSRRRRLDMPKGGISDNEVSQFNPGDGSIPSHVVLYHLFSAPYSENAFVPFDYRNKSQGQHGSRYIRNKDGMTGTISGCLAATVQAAGFQPPEVFMESLMASQITQKFAGRLDLSEPANSIVLTPGFNNQNCQNLPFTASQRTNAHKTPGASHDSFFMVEIPEQGFDLKTAIQNAAEEFDTPMRDKVAKIPAGLWRSEEYAVLSDGWLFKVSEPDEIGVQKVEVSKQAPYGALCLDSSQPDSSGTRFRIINTNAKAMVGEGHIRDSVLYLNLNETVLAVKIEAYPDQPDHVRFVPDSELGLEGLSPMKQGNIRRFLKIPARFKRQSEFGHYLPEC